MYFCRMSKPSDTHCFELEQPVTLGCAVQNSQAQKKKHCILKQNVTKILFSVSD